MESENSIECPACAETIPSDSRICPECEEILKQTISPELVRSKVKEVVEGIAEERANPSAMQSLSDIKGGRFSKKTVIAFTFLILGTTLLIYGISNGRNYEGFNVVGIILMIISSISLLVCMIHDNQANNIQSSSKPEIAYKRFFMSIRSGRIEKAYVALSPYARKSQSTQPIKFEKIPYKDKQEKIKCLNSFKNYLQFIFKGENSHQRQVKLKKVTLLKSTDDKALIEVKVNFTSYSNWLYLLIFINLIICIIVVAIVQKKETKTFKKLLLRDGDNWIIADAELCGELDSFQFD
jgi:hypothetical protein